MGIEHDRRMNAYLYISRCADGAYYVGTTCGSLETRLSQHEAGVFDCYPARRRPLTLVFHQEFERIDDAVAAERQSMGRHGGKKEPLIRSNYGALRALSRRTARPRVRASRAQQGCC
jgi:predicted GIY-YIG superfamily endonuclease